MKAKYSLLLILMVGILSLFINMTNIWVESQNSDLLGNSERVSVENRFIFNKKENMILYETTDEFAEIYEYIDSELEKAKKDLEDTIASRCYTEAEVDAKLAALNTAISNAQKAAELYADNQDVALKQEIEASIADTKTEVYEYIDSELEQAKKDLENTITSRCYTEAEVDAEIARLSDLIRKAEKVAKEYADDNDSAFKQELDASIVSAKTELLDAINIIDEKYDQKINILNGEISNIQSKMKTLSIILYSCIGLLTSCILVIVFILTKKKKNF